MTTTRRQWLTLSGAALAGTMVRAAEQPRRPSRLTQIRNATLRIEYAGVRFLVDPMLADRDSYPGFAGTANSERRNPLVPLPVPAASLLDVDALIVTHLHEDHWDSRARTIVPKHLPLFVQDERDAGIVRGQGFTDVRVLTEASIFRGVRLSRTRGRHGSEAAHQAIGARLGSVCGVVFAQPGEKTVYVAGDTIWNADVAAALAAHAPDLAVLNTGAATVLGLDRPITMHADDVLAVHEAAPAMTIVASHLEALNHCTLSRAELRSFARASGFSDRLLIPADGASIDL